MKRALCVAALVAATWTLHLRAAAASPAICVVGEGERVARRAPLPDRCAPRAELEALRGEYAAFQLVVDASDAPLDSLELSVEPAGAWQISVEHFVHVERRSRTEGTRESLAFTAAARPEDASMLGDVPDALLSLGDAAGELVWVPARDRRVFFLEAFVPPDAAPGRVESSVVVRASGTELARVPIALDVSERVLPYRPVSVFAFYEYATLERHFRDPVSVERELVQLLHAHGLEGITQTLSKQDVERLSGAIDGAWFTSAAGYRGPGEGAPATVWPIGAYGTLGEPSPAGIETVRAVRGAMPDRSRDLFVYAIDETCESPRGLEWRGLLDEAGLGDVAVGHTCGAPPATQDVDIVMMPSSAFDPDLAADGRRAGKKVWIYNGILPHSGPLMLDVPVTSLTANGWIAATFDVGRWFYWETIFWDDKNRGGLGPRDVFADPETFHNADGDTALYDGLLVFPPPPWRDRRETSAPSVLASLRLKALRRGVEDAALLGLAATVDPSATYAIARRIVPRALDEVSDDEPTALDLDPTHLAEARRELRAMVARGSSSNARRGLQVLRDLRSKERARHGRYRNESAAMTAAVMLGIPAALFAIGAAITRVARGLSRGRPRSAR
ncbi:MAG: DUF4091 domain-containing protein [Polyangiaceae bacterium]